MADKIARTSHKMAQYVIRKGAGGTVSLVPVTGFETVRGRVLSQDGAVEAYGIAVSEYDAAVTLSTVVPDGGLAKVRYDGIPAAVLQERRVRFRMAKSGADMAIRINHRAVARKASGYVSKLRALNAAAALI